MTINQFDVLVDLNDSMWKTRRAARQFFERHTGLICPPEMHFRKTTVIGAILRNVRGEAEKVTSELYHRVMDRFYAGGGFVGRVELFPHCVKVLHRLLRERYRVGIVTDSETMPKEKVELELAWQGFADVPIVFTRDGDASEEEGKAPYYAHAMKLVLDDKLSHLRKTRTYCMERGLICPTLLLMQSLRPEAQDVSPDEGITRITGWDQLWFYLDSEPRRIAA